jgi:hypothetical protein
MALPPGRRFTTTFACWCLLFSSLGVLWALATPIGASPDSPSQVARAASVVRGQWLGPRVPGPTSDVNTYVRVPKTYDYTSPMVHCYMFEEAVSAACAAAPTPSAQIVRTMTHVGRYPPAYYLAVGWPSLLTKSVAGLYLMQAASVVLCSIFLALAVATARMWSSSALMVPAIAVAATPMALFLSSSVNPSGLEVAASVAMWTAATVLVAEHLASPPKALVAVLAASTGALVWTRPTALVWPVMVVAVLAPAAWGRLQPGVLLRADILTSAGGFAITALGAVLWVVLAGATSVLKNFVPLPATSSFHQVVSFVIGHFPSLLAQGVGNFGWLDTPVPRFVLAAWALLGAALVAVAIVHGSRVHGSKRTLASLLIAVLTSFFVPVVSLVAVAHSYGYAGQGRYFLAIWAGVPLVAVGLVGAGTARRWARPLTIATGVLVASGQAVAFYWALRRYIVGIPGPLIWSENRASGRPQWHPPVPGWWLLGIFVALSVVYGVAISRPGLTGEAPRTGRKT